MDNVAHQNKSDRQNEYRMHLLSVRWRLLSHCQDENVRRGNLARCCVGHYVRREDISVVRSSRLLDDGNEWHGAYYDGLIKCDTWLCPVCGRHIAHERCSEIKAAGESWLREGGCLAMVTLTLRHRAGDSLSMLDDGLSRAMETFARNGSVRRILRAAGNIGRIRSYECQYGQVNGYHPHCHNLFFLRRQLTGREKRVFHTAWVSAVKAAGFEASFENGLSYAECDNSLPDYLTKVKNFGAEMSLGNMTKDNSSNGHYSPLQLLALCAKGEAWAGRVYLEEVLTLRGKSFIRWSKGLKARFGIGEINDTEARKIGEQQESRVEVAAMSGDDYQATNWRHRGRLLDTVAASCLDDFSGLAEVGFRAVPGEACQLPRLVSIVQSPADNASCEDDSLMETETETVPDADMMPPPPSYRIGTATAPTSPSLPFASYTLPYPLAPLGRIVVVAPPDDSGIHRPISPQ